jgi:ribonuclease T1
MRIGGPQRDWYTARMTPHRALAALALALAVALPPAAPLARTTTEALPDVALAELPVEARDTLRRIRAGGPFPYERDGIRFGNREKLLPAKPRDYYREYTVKTAGMSTRGARRIVCGGPSVTPEACYYTRDHYRSFARIRE